MSEEIKWTTREYIGTEVYHSQADLDASRTMKKGDEPTEGQEIIVPTLTGWTTAKVVRDKYGNLHAETEHRIWPLEISHDDRECWVAMGCINKKCLDKLCLVHGEVETDVSSKEDGEALLRKAMKDFPK